MEEDEALQLLLGKSPAHSEVRPGLQIIDLLGRLPLAIDQARAYIAQCSIPSEAFITEYESQKRAILGNAPPFSQYKRRVSNSTEETALSVITTWEMSFSQLHSADSKAILTLLGFFHPIEISELLFTFRADAPNLIHSPMSRFVCNGKWDHVSFRNEIAAMQQLSLLQLHHRNESAIVISIHSLVSEWLRVRIEENDIQYYLRIAMLHILNYASFHEHQVRTTRNEVVAHITTIAYIADKRIDYNIFPFYGVAHSFALLYEDQGRLEEAERMYERALSGYEKALGPNHTSTLNTVNNLGILYKLQGRLEEAERMYERALAGYEKALGPSHTSTLKIVNNLGILYRSQGRPEEAERVYERYNI